MVRHLQEEETLTLLKNQSRVIIMFVANWCGSCRLFKPRFDKISNKPAFSNIEFVCINSEEAPRLRKIAGVSALPYFASFSGGELFESRATIRENAVVTMAQNLAENGA